jgi:DNA-directed RNA polymerase specialized sigma24 family protein
MSTIDPQNPSLEAVTDLETADGSNDNATEVATVDTSHLLTHPHIAQYLRAVLWHNGVDSQDMHDVLTDVLADTLEAARKAGMPTTLESWRALAATIAFRTAVDRLRHEEVVAKYDVGLCGEPDAYEHPTLHWEHRDPVDTKKYLAVLKDLFDAGHMPEQGAEILQDAADEVPQAETAAELGITESCVSNRLFRMRTRFRTRLAALGMLTLILMLLPLVQVPFLALLARPGTNVAAPAPSRTPADKANDLRADGLHACDAGAWQDCLTRLDAARALDPRGDDAPAVRKARQHAEEALHGRVLDGTWH